MTPEQLLHHYDHAGLWPAASGLDLPGAYQRALAVRRLRMARGEQPRGYKIGFTNRGIWPRYQVFAPIWGTVWNTTLTLGDQEILPPRSLTACSSLPPEGTHFSLGRPGGKTGPRRSLAVLSLTGTCQPRLEPEAVFGMAATPPPNPSPDELLACIAWVAPGFEIVQSHQPDWKFCAADTVADGALHARLLVGARVPVAGLARGAQAFGQALAAARVTLSRNGEQVDQGAGANVLDGPLQALHYFLQELRSCPGAADLQPGDVVTTGTWTDAWPVAPGEVWTAHFEAPLSNLTVRFS